MKQLLAMLIITCCMAGCKEEKQNKPSYKIQVVAGADTLEIENMNIDFTKVHSSWGHIDTITNTMIVTLKPAIKIVYDTIYTSKHYDNVRDVYIGIK